ncbi:MAG: hypothetical protein FJ405_00635 [Verrucomicrobia bacterium]|nr:hypothetical protein [Verrucomicrobiota bacterium]
MTRNACTNGLRLTALLLSVAASSAGLTAFGASMPSIQTLLFVDDHHVLYRAGTQRVLQPLKRHSENPLIPGRNKPYEAAIAWCSVYHNPASGVYQVWYQAFAGDEARDRTRRCVVAYAESTDGLRFTKPNLGLFDYNGTKDTSIVLVGNGGTSDRYGVSVVVDPLSQDVNRRYKMAHFDFTKDNGVEYPGLNVAFSPDGIHWTKHPRGPLSRISYGDYGDLVPFVGETNRPWSIPLSMADAMDALYDPVREVFAIYGKMWIDGPDGGMHWKHATGRIESKDFIQWSKPELVAAPDDEDSASVEFHTMPVFQYGGIYFAPLQILNRATQGGVVDVELALSRDGLNWRRPFRKPFWLGRSDGGKFDSGAIFLCAQPVILDDEIRFYYGAYSKGATGSDDLKLTTGIGLATMPRDRFAGLKPVPRSDQPTLKKRLENIGQVTLKPMDFAGVKSLELNADAVAGSIRVEVLNSEGRRVRGFNYDEATPITGDSLRHSIRWRERGVKDLPAGNHMLRLHLDNATIYALSIHRLY